MLVSQQFSTTMDATYHLQTGGLGVCVVVMSTTETASEHTQ